jgi:TRAP-type C4-dicarboxylate transport system permease small subunit
MRCGSILKEEVAVSIVKWLDKHFEHVVLGVFLIILTVFSFLNVTLRYLLESGIPWSDEVCKFSLVLSGFFSIPAWIRYRTGIRVDAFIQLLPKKSQKILDYAVQIIMLLFFGFMLNGTFVITRGAHQINLLSPALRLPMKYLYGVVAFAFFLSILRLVQVVALQLKTDLRKAEDMGAKV